MKRLTLLIIAIALVFTSVVTAPVYAAEETGQEPGQEITTPQEEQTQKVYYIRYYKNSTSATGDMDDEITTVYYGQSTVTAKNKFKRTGYGFGGWAIKDREEGKFLYKKDGHYDWFVYKHEPEGYKLAIYDNKEVVATTTDVHGKVLTFYAQWKTPTRIRKALDKLYKKVGKKPYNIYKYVRDHTRYIIREKHIKTIKGYTREQSYALEGLEKHKGNCFTFAAQFSIAMKDLGYKAKWINGRYWSGHRDWYPHGFVTIVIKGKKYIYDPEFEWAVGNDRNLYHQDAKKPKLKYGYKPVKWGAK